MTDRVSPVEEVTETTLTFVCGDNVGLVTSRGQNSGLQDIADTIETALAGLSLTARGLEDYIGIIFQRSELLLA
jgi:hypothetical protein